MLYSFLKDVDVIKYPEGHYIVKPEERGLQVMVERGSPDDRLYHFRQGDNVMAEDLAFDLVEELFDLNLIEEG